MWCTIIYKYIFNSYEILIVTMLVDLEQKRSSEKRDFHLILEFSSSHCFPMEKKFEFHSELQADTCTVTSTYLIKSPIAKLFMF